jgi:hypothetical protein
LGADFTLEAAALQEEDVGGGINEAGDVFLAATGTLDAGGHLGDGPQQGRAAGALAGKDANEVAMIDAQA